MKCLIVDDDKMARVSLENFCQRIEGLEVVGLCSDALQAMEVLRASTVDLLFLDVEMPHLTGMELVKNMKGLPLIIFITSKVEYAVEAFELKELVVDYITKPVGFSRFVKAVDRAREKISEEQSLVTKDYIFIRSDGRLIRINLQELLYVETVGDYVRFKTAEKAYLVHSTLKGIDEKLQHPDFLKVHRSYIINLSKIVDIEDNSVLIREKVIPVSRAHRNLLLKKINPI